MMAAQEIIELFCELLVVRLPIIEAQRECPLDLKEAISSMCFAAPSCVDLPELIQVQMAFASKYGKEFVDDATELIFNLVRTIDITVVNYLCTLLGNITVD